MVYKIIQNITKWFNIHFTKNKIKIEKSKQKNPCIRKENFHNGITSGTRYFYKDGTSLEMWDLIPEPGFSSTKL